ncbi:MAG: hypothetical protein JNK67_24565 [Alphaproteobacteria bacterium]|nr:hypothetical protein [Alphaproteobacteria bacterium]
MSARLKPADPDAGALDEAAQGVVHQAKDRRCLTCRTTFASEWSGERVCPRCKTKSGWRGGYRLSSF